MRSASFSSSPRYGPSPTISSTASGTSRRICGSAAINVSCPLRGTSRDTQTTTGRSVRPSAARTASPPESGRKVPSSTPGGSCTIRAAAAGPTAEAIRERVYSPR
ncbi:hypothetical protein GCM10020229_06150 [Kitasatospora albolonga]